MVLINIQFIKIIIYVTQNIKRSYVEFPVCGTKFDCQVIIPDLINLFTHRHGLRFSQCHIDEYLYLINSRKACNSN